VARSNFNGPHVWHNRRTFPKDAQKFCRRSWKVTAEMKRVESLLNLNLDLSLPRLLRPCLGQGASLGKEAVVAASGRASEKSGFFSSLLKVRFAI
jgi:hypothetical protein